ncbi:hypothetical protein BC834DRAFT_86830 [Gloeopeniophorella convolvens]|nr:hypothetical protein BC834DRAFT_86830 [Gloeopeniophorella convolvens]
MAVRNTAATGGPSRNENFLRTRKPRLRSPKLSSRTSVRLGCYRFERASAALGGRTVALSKGHCALERIVRHLEKTYRWRLTERYIRAFKACKIPSMNPSRQATYIPYLWLRCHSLTSPQFSGADKADGSFQCPKISELSKPQAQRSLFPRESPRDARVAHPE